MRLCALVLLVAMTACQKEVSYEINGNNGGVNPGSGTQVTGVLKMKVDGTQWVADKIAGAGIMANYINITGMNKNGMTFSITLNDTIARTYTLNHTYTPGNLNGAVLSNDSIINNSAWGTVQGDDSNAGGTVTVTKIDKVNKRITGTFEFKMFRNMDSSQKIITAGEFDLGYGTQMPQASAKDTFFAKIDGTNGLQKVSTLPL